MQAWLRRVWHDVIHPSERWMRLLLQVEAGILALVAVIFFIEAYMGEEAARLILIYLMLVAMVILDRLLFALYLRCRQWLNWRWRSQ